MINKNLIVLDYEAKDRLDVISNIALLMDRNGNIIDRQGYIDAVIEREETFPTCFDFGVAIPHGKTDSVKEACFSFLRLKNPMKWCGEDSEAVRLIFQIAVPESNAGDLHLQILAKLSRNLMHEEFRNTLLEAEDKNEVLELLQNI